MDNNYILEKDLSKMTPTEETVMTRELLDYCESQGEYCKKCIFAKYTCCPADLNDYDDIGIYYDIYKKHKQSNNNSSNKKIVIYDIERNQENLLYIMCDKGYFSLSFSTFDDLAEEIIAKTCVCDDVIEENYISFSDGHSAKRIRKELTQVIDIYILDINKLNGLYVKLKEVGLQINMLERINQEEYLKINFENITNIKKEECE